MTKNSATSKKQQSLKAGSSKEADQKIQDEIATSEEIPIQADAQQSSSVLPEGSPVDPVEREDSPLIIPYPKSKKDKIKAKKAERKQLRKSLRSTQGSSEGGPEIVNLDTDSDEDSDVSANREEERLDEKKDPRMKYWEDNEPITVGGWIRDLILTQLTISKETRTNDIHADAQRLSAYMAEKSKDCPKEWHYGGWTELLVTDPATWNIRLRDYDGAVGRRLLSEELTEYACFLRICQLKHNENRRRRPFYPELVLTRGLTILLTTSFDEKYTTLLPIYVNMANPQEWLGLGWDEAKHSLQQDKQSQGPSNDFTWKGELLFKEERAAMSQISTAAEDQRQKRTIPLETPARMLPLQAPEKAEEEQSPQPQGLLLKDIRDDNSRDNISQVTSNRKPTAQELRQQLKEAEEEERKLAQKPPQKWVNRHKIFDRIKASQETDTIRQYAQMAPPSLAGPIIEEANRLAMSSASSADRRMISTTYVPPEFKVIEAIDHAAIERIKNNWNHANMHGVQPEMKSYFTTTAQNFLSRVAGKEWTTLQGEEFFRLMGKIFTDPTDLGKGSGANAKARNLKIHFVLPEYLKQLQLYMKSIDEIVDKTEETVDEKELVKILINNFGKGVPTNEDPTGRIQSEMDRIRDHLLGKERPQTRDAFYDLLIRELQDMADNVIKTNHLKSSSSSARTYKRSPSRSRSRSHSERRRAQRSPARRRSKSPQRRRSRSPKGKPYKPAKEQWNQKVAANNTEDSGEGTPPTPVEGPISECWGCGNKHPGKCNLIDKRGYNHENVPFKESKVGKKWWAQRQRNSVDAKYDLDGEPQPGAKLRHGERFIPPEKRKERNDYFREKRKERSRSPHPRREDRREEYRGRDDRDEKGRDRHRRRDSRSPEERGKRRKEGKKEFLNAIDNDERDENYDNIEDTVLMLLSPKGDGIENNITNKVNSMMFTDRALIDTGAVQGNYLSAERAQLLASQGAIKHECSTMICSALKQACEKCLGLMKINAFFCNELNQKIESMFLTCTIINTNYDLIVGRKAIKDYNLLSKLPSQFAHLGATSKEGKHSGLTMVAERLGSRNCKESAELSTSDLTYEQAMLHIRREDNLRPFTESSQVVASLWEAPRLGQIAGKNNFLDMIPDDDFIEEGPDIMELLPVDHSDEAGKIITNTNGERSQSRHTAHSDIGTDHTMPLKGGIQKTSLNRGDEYRHQPQGEPVSNIPTDIQGSEELRADLIRLCEEFIDIFSRELRPDPARLAPMKLKVDTKGWKTKRNQNPPRRQSLQANDEIKRQIDNMLKHKVIEQSTAAYASQVLLAPKPGGKWRFCIDFRNLNLLTEIEGWPLPLIRDILRRLGEHRGCYYALMDLTSGYYQLGLDRLMRAFSAFICFCGIFHWLRVPMGLKGAPAYFQKQMVTIVLVGLVYMICEVYLDDVIVHGRTEKELVDRLRLIFLRFRQFNLTLNPDKCKFGLQSIEYVGHVIDETGISMSTERIHNVLQFDEPKTLRFLKQFLGIANYFRQHIVNYSMVTRPLHQLLLGYTKKKKSVEIKWTDETRQAFKDTKDAINDCKKLYFLQKEGLITVRTDASDYAIGAYLCQLQDGIERPIEFVSKSLIKEQIRWSTPEKEGYAIYFCLMELECHLRGRKFLLQTDHANLTHINLSGSPKVIRWKLALQEFDFEIQHIKGVHNTVADALSRLRPVESIQKEVLYGIREYTKDIPRGIYKNIKMCHSPLNGHWGVEKTLNMLRIRLRGSAGDRKSPEGIIIPPDVTEAGEETEGEKNLRKWVRQYIRQCPCCQKMSHLKLQIQTHPFTVATYAPMYALNVDTMGPFIESNQGFTYIIVIIDCFTRFVELYPSTGATGVEAAQALLQHFGRYGSPSLLKSDNGPQFINELIEEFLKAVGTDHELSLAYSSEENGIVERANKEVLRHLKMMIFTDNSKEKWSAYLPLVQRIINSTTHSSTGISPAEALFGNNIKLEQGIFLPPENFDIERPKEIRMSEWVAEMLINQASIIDVAQKNQFEKDWIHHYGTAHEEPPKFEKNSYVLVNNVSKFTGKPPSKLHFHWKGPMRVVNNDVPNKYTLQDLITLKLSDYHVTSLKKFIYDPAMHDPTEVANRDENTFTVEEILSHSGKLNDKETLLFRVKWLGLGAEQNSDETYETLKRNEYLHAYLTKINAKHLIPRAFRTITVKPIKIPDPVAVVTGSRKRKRNTEGITKKDRPARMRRPTARFNEEKESTQLA